jgi:predicted nucleic acid-binding protein
MTTYYLDTSALSKRYVQEIGTEWIRALAAKDEHTLLTARVTMVEVYSALARRKREGFVPLRAYDAIQLASAMVANQALDTVQLAGLIFVSADDRLNTVAAAEGLAVDNPNRR